MTENGESVWFSELRQNGMLISPTVLDEFLEPGMREIDERKYLRLRDEYAKFVASSANEDTDRNVLRRWVDAVLGDFLGHEGSNWQKGPDVVPSFRTVSITRESLRPDRVLLWQGSAAFPARYLVKIDDSSKHVGMGRGRNEYSKLLELLRGTGVKIGILTNGKQFRLVYAGLDHDCWIEWEVQRWFEDALGKEQLAGFLSLCGPWGVNKRDGVENPLYQAIVESRSRQGELSQVLGEQTRLAVEELLQALDRSARTNKDLMACLVKDPSTGREVSEEEQLDALYQASIRIIMRTVVAFFAESRDLLPRDNELYNSSYGVEGLFAQLNKASKSDGEVALEDHRHSWPRLLALFRLIHEGSSSSHLPITAYGGGLFQRGDASSPDMVLRALSIFEDARTEISDLTVFKVLQWLKIGKTRAKVGRSTKMVSGPVDFSDLRTEYIGMMYEGLLDYKLRRVSEEQEAVVILNLGQQPALPFSLLRKASSSELKDLIKNLSQEKAGSTIEDEEEDSEERAEEETGSLEEEELVEEILGGYEETPTDVDDQVRQWAMEAVETAGLVRKPRGKKKDSTFVYEKEKNAAAKRLILDIIKPGETYLIRGSGTRKGTGTFYTKPQLAVPTVRRTLEPLLYTTVEEEGQIKSMPRAPERVLAVKVCDPAMGSGSFLVAALNYITDALYESLLKRNHFKNVKEGTAIVLPAGDGSEGLLAEELVKRRQGDELFESTTKAQLKRYVVERCIYGVDINPLAVELAKLSLWVETMDRELPFGFLDHKLKSGNSLVGCWFDQFQEYPLMAWKREGGDENHRGTHHPEGKWAKLIKKTLNDTVKPDLIQIIDGQTTLDKWDYSDNAKIERIYDNAVRLFEELHEIPFTGDGHERRETFYHERILNDPQLRDLRERFDLWCAIWFWPGDWLEADVPTPTAFYSKSKAILEKAKIVAGQMQFFHWELEFPDVFVTGKGGFDAIVGNPPWEASKPVSKEFFTLYDPIYRTYGKQEALSRQKELFERNAEIEEKWIAYNAHFKSMTNWVKNAAFAFGDPEEKEGGGASISLANGKKGKALHDAWRRERQKHVSFADASHPFRYQGAGDINTYKLFLEASHMLARKGGRIGLIVPSGVYTDKGTMELRELFLKRSKWERIFCFENRKKIFQIDSRFKFCPVIIEKGGRTKAISAAFMRHDLADWEDAGAFSIDYPIELISKFSPKCKSILEIRSPRDLEILEKIYSNSVLLGDDGPDGWGIKYSTEFHMTNDSWRFPPREWWEDNGYVHSLHGIWINNGLDKDLIYHSSNLGNSSDRALPLYEGVMIHQFNFNNAAFNPPGETGWQNINLLKREEIYPQYLLNEREQRRISLEYGSVKNVIRDMARATDTRTTIAALIPDFPCAHVINVLRLINNDTVERKTVFTAILNSFIYDYCIRTEMGGTHLSKFILEDTPLPKPNLATTYLSFFSSRLSLNSWIFAKEWLELKKYVKFIEDKKISSLWALTEHETIRLRAITDAICAEIYGLEYSDFQWILRQDISEPRGFWRVDKNKPIELKYPTIALAAFHSLKKYGIEVYIKLNNGDGWMIPEKLRFSVREDGTIDFDDPNGTEYEVASKLGPRFLDWQLEGTPEESWKECEMHARNILGEKGFEEFMDKLNEAPVAPSGEVSIKSVLDKAAKGLDNVQAIPQARLFDFKESEEGDKA